jgi:hypothetical protein
MTYGAIFVRLIGAAASSSARRAWSNHP